MLIGDDFFLSHRVMVSRAQRRLFFTYNGGPVFRLEPRTEQAKMTVSAAGADVPAAAATEAPTTAEAFARRGDASAARRDYAAAIADLSKAIELSPDTLEYYRDRAAARMNASQGDAALADLDHALKLKPEDRRILLMRGELYLRRRDETNARADFEAAEKLPPADPVLPLQIALAWSRAGFIDESLKQLDAWIDANPKSAALPAALYDRCSIRAFWGRAAERALADCDAAMQRGLRGVNVMEARGIALYRLGRSDDALKQFEAALRLQPKAGWALYGRGLVRVKKGDETAGRWDLETATNLEPQLSGLAKRYGLAPESGAAATAKAGG